MEQRGPRSAARCKDSPCGRRGDGSKPAAPWQLESQLGSESVDEIETHRTVDEHDSLRAAPRRTLDSVCTRVDEVIPEKYRSVFSFDKFNYVQSSIIDTVMKSSQNVVLCAPTGCGKTAIAEASFIRELQRFAGRRAELGKFVFLAPMRAICQERYNDWTKKFQPFGLSVALLSSSQVDLMEQKPLSAIVRDADIIVTTPERWDRYVVHPDVVLSMPYPCNVSLQRYTKVERLHSADRNRPAACH